MQQGSRNPILGRPLAPFGPSQHSERLKTLKQMRRRFSADYDTFFDMGSNTELEGSVLVLKWQKGCFSADYFGQTSKYALVKTYILRLT